MSKQPMHKLEDIPKTSIFQVPEKYFDHLPAKIQARMDEQPSRAKKTVWQYAVQYALPLLIVAGIVYYYNYSPAINAESILASVDTADLVQYLQQDATLTTDDLIEGVDFAPAEIEAIENAIYDSPIDGTSDQEIELELITL
jgi:hypothetical protein